MDEQRCWRIAGRSPHHGVAEGWREQLIARLGQRPRRLGLLSELGLYGALEALAEAGEQKLPEDTRVRVCSLRGPLSAIAHVLEQIDSDLPLPFSFLQSQPSQMLAALASAMQWQGDASFMLTRDPLALIALTARQAGRQGMLFGWVEEEPATSQWLRLVPVPIPAAPFTPLTGISQLFDPTRQWLLLAPAGLAVA